MDKRLISYRLSHVSDLQQAILKLWMEIFVGTCANLVRSMPGRIKRCAHVKGSTS